MKKLLLLASIVFTAAFAHAQYTWSNAIPPNPEISSPTTPQDVVMKNNMVYQVYDSAGTKIKISTYDPYLGQWKKLDFSFNPNFTYRLQSILVNGNIYTVASGFSGFTMFKYDFATGTMNQLAAIQNYTSLSENWEFKANEVTGKFFVVNVDNGSSIFINEYLEGGNTWISTDVSNILNSGFQTIAGNKLELYCSTSNIYCGISGVNTLGIAPITNVAALSRYNSGGTNDGKLYLNGSVLVNGNFYLSGNGQTAPLVVIQNTATKTSYEKAFVNTNINVIEGTDPSISFNISSTDHHILENTAYVFNVSAFSSIGSTVEDKHYVYRKNVSTGVWDSIGPQIELNNNFVFTPNSLRLGLEQTQQKHLAVFYRDNVNNNGGQFKVLNNRPSIQVGSVQLNTGLCVGNTNEIYSQIIFQDDDVEQVRIVAVYSPSGLFSNLTAVGTGYDPAFIPSLNKFKIYGNIIASGTGSIIIVYTDGWNQYTDTLTPITVSATPPIIAFNAPVLNLCSNENIIDLSNYVNYFDQGIFTLNGNILNTTQVNGIQLSQTATSGIIGYKVNVDGCIVETSAGYNIVTPGTATTTTSPATCNGLDGTAQVTYVPGTSNNFTVEWSTGETTASISGLDPGAVYYNVTDEFGCHVTGMASVENTSFSLSPNISNVTCHGAANGSLSVTVGGPSTYSVLWSNGYSNTTISNLEPGTYWVTVRDLVSDCEITKSYTITEPAPITASFTTYDPDCGVSNGVIYGTYAGGVAPLAYNWIGQGQFTPDLVSVPYGFYQVLVVDGAGCSKTFDFQLNDYQAATIIDSVSPANCFVDNGAIFIQFQTSPFGGNLPSSLTWSNGNPFLNNFNLLAGSYTIDAVSGPSGFNGNMCHSAKTILVGNKAPAKQPICIVTVDTTTTTNLVVWEKVESFGIDHYNIYRENTVAGTFSLIDTVDYNNLSAFNDVVSSAMDKSWRYKISAVNSCGVEGPISETHKTLHLNSIEVAANNSNNIFWDDYEGDNGSASYIVWRKTDQATWSAVSPAIPLGTTTYNDLPPAGSTGVDYYVEMLLDFPCSAEKAQDFNTTRSNRDKGSFAAGEGTGNSSNTLSEQSAVSFTIYPNPASEQLTLNISENGMHKTARIVSINGVEVLQFTVEYNTQNIPVQQLSNGMYFIEIEGALERIPFIKQ